MLKFQSIFSSYLYRLFLVLFCLFFSSGLSAQNLEEENRLALWMKARAFEKQQLLDSAIIYYEEFFNRYPTWDNVGFRLANLYFIQRDYHRAFDVYKKLYEQDPDKNILALYSFSEVAKILGESRIAEMGFEQFLREFKPDGNLDYLKKLARNNLEGIEMLEEDTVNNLNNPALGKRFNLPFNHIQYLNFSENPSIKSIFFDCEDIDGVFSRALDWLNDSLQYLDGDYTWDKYFFSTELPDKNEVSRYVLCQCFREELRWSRCEIMPESMNVHEFNSLLPAVGNSKPENQLILYFVSDREQGRGGYDIWYAQYDDRRQQFRPPKNLGSKINTAANEWSPFYDTLSRTLYFSSNGWPGFGGYDVFQATGEMRSWTQPVHVGGEVNSTFDDYYFQLANEKQAVFASNRKAAPELLPPHAKDNWYNLKLEDKNLASIQIHIGWNGFDMATREAFKRFNQPVSMLNIPDSTKVQIYLYLVDDNEKIFIEAKNGKIGGEVSFSVMPGKYYSVAVDSNFRGDSDIFTVESKDSDYIKQLDVNSREKKTLQTTLLYPLDGFLLYDSSISLLDSTVLFVYNHFPEASIKINSYTDNTGSDLYNVKLSKKRAKTVYNYLVQKGVVPERIDFKGYGEIEMNETDKEINRRTDIFITF